jgi:hypothetical protein
LCCAQHNGRKSEATNSHIAAATIDETAPKALALSPDLAGYDEPDMNLDASSGAELNALGAAVERLFSDHDD